MRARKRCFFAISKRNTKNYSIFTVLFHFFVIESRYSLAHLLYNASFKFLCLRLIGSG